MMIKLEQQISTNVKFQKKVSQYSVLLINDFKPYYHIAFRIYTYSKMKRKLK